MKDIKNLQKDIYHVLSNVFQYDPLTGEFTRDGKPTGCVNKSSGYLLLSYNYKRYYGHRVAFVCMGEPLPEQVDHKDGVRSNNAWTNLKPSTNIKNSKNSAMKSNNTSGSTGVYWSERDKIWIGEVTIGGKKIYIGRSKNLDEIGEKVEEYRLQKGFSKRHGKRH